MSSSTSKQTQIPAKSARGRKPSSKPAPEKKQPQRGLGVAQLERLRLQERWRKMTEIPPTDGDINHGSPTQPLESVPVQYGAGSFGGDAARIFHGGVGGSGAVMDHGGIVFLDHNSPRNNYLDHNNNMNSNKKKRLISGNMMNNTFVGSQSDHQILQMGIPGMNNIYPNSQNNNTNIPNYYYVNNNHNNNTNINNASVGVGDHLTLGFGGTITHSKSLPSDLNIVQSLDHVHPHHRHQGVEIRAVHKRGIEKSYNNNININNNSNINGGIIGNQSNNVVMEYEFFPGLNDSVSKPELSYHHHHHHHHQEASSSSSSLSNYYNNLANNGSQAGSSGVSTSSPTSHNNNLDLSLKL